ncbi:MAG: DUF4388 domain-containing protein [Nitrospirae bacterium]|nr:MAG: DUF4388 domain-containing protein [Nitrospirota bacterium]
MALEGSIKEFGLADILQLIYFQKKTGTLRVEGPFDTVSIYFRDGNIVGSKSNKRPEALRVGRILVKKGYITEEMLSEALKEHRQRNIRLGDVLLEKQLVDIEVLRETLTRQVTDQIVHLFSWKEGSYVFRPGEIRADSKLELSLDTQHLLMEGLRIVDEWSVVEGKITIDTVFRKTHKTELEEYTKDLGDTELYLLSFIDGESDVGTITEVAALDDLDVSRALIRLKDRGLIEEVKEAVSVEPIGKEAARPVSRALLYVFLVLLLLTLFFFPLRRFAEDFKTAADRVVTAKRVEDLRLKIEAERLLKGSFPEAIESLKDSWGEEIVYQRKGDSYYLFSKGPDRREHTEDDIY